MSYKDDGKDSYTDHKQPAASVPTTSPLTDTEAATAASSSAAATTPCSDYTIAQTLQTIEQLTSIFQFTYKQAEDAVNHVGADVTLAYNYILDQGGSDRGGPIVPKSDCPHIARHVKGKCNNVDTFNFKSDNICCYFTEEEASYVRKSKRKCEVVDGKCPNGENWICLECGAVRCSRYINGHAKDHWENTKAAEISQASKDGGDGTEAVGHCISLSLEDLSVWCYACNAYLNNSDLVKLVKKFERLKFDDDNDEADRNIEEKAEEGNPGNDCSKNNEHQYDKTKGNESKSAYPTIAEEYNEGTDDCKSEISQSEGRNELNNSGSEMESNSSSESEDDEKEVLEEDNYLSTETPHPYLPKSLKDLANFIKSDDCRSIVILAGAGMSRSSGIPDFRSAGGLYDSLQVDKLTATESQKELIRSDPSAVFDKHLFLENPLPCLECKRPFILGTKERKWKTTLAHRFIEMLHVKTEKLTRLYQQNIDGLERQCSNLPKELVVPVHGSMDRVACELPECQAEMNFDEFCDQIQSNIKDISGADDSAPSFSTPIKCESCSNNTMKPTVVLFHSPLPDIFFRKIIEDLPSTDLIIVIGTSLAVGPANSLVHLVPDECLRVVINNEPVGFRLGIDYSEDATRDYFARGTCDGILLNLMEEMGWIDDLENIMHKLSDSSKELLTDYLEHRRSAK